MTQRPFRGVPNPEQRPTLNLWPETGQILNLSKASVYAAAERGEIPTIRVGRRLLVPTAALRQILSLDKAAEAEPNAGGNAA
jgi:excisionase family DNA binding protein